MLTKVAEKLSIYGKEALVKAKIHKPEIYMGLGVVCIGVGIFLSCRATLEVDEIVEEHNNDMDRIHDAFDNKKTLKSGEIYSKEHMQRDTVKRYGKTCFRLGRVYAPGIGFTVLGVGFFFAAYRVLKIRNAQLIVACETIANSFMNYRQRVIEDYGEETDYNYIHGIRSEEVDRIETQENGKKKKVKETQLVGDGKLTSPYSRFFDESSKYWRSNSDVNLLFLKTQERWANDLLKKRRSGAVFLNEVLEMLDIPPCPTGQFVGWLRDGDGDGYIDFGIFDQNGSVADRRFVNGYEDVILLDFNVDGVIHDKL